MLPPVFHFSAGCWTYSKQRANLEGTFYTSKRLADPV
jgi:hypothetical protein